MLTDRAEQWYEKMGKKFGRVISFILILFGVYIFFKYILELILPFVIAWILASLLDPFVTFLKKKLKVHRGLGTLLSMATVLTAFFGLITFLVKLLWQQIVGFADAFPNYAEQIQYTLENIQVQFQGVMDTLPLPEAIQSLDDLINTVLNSISGFLSDLVSSTASIVSKVPNGVFFVIVVLIATFFMTKDRKMIKDFVKAQLPEKLTDKVVLLQNGLKRALGGYVKTQLILMCFTFVICLIGLLILQRPYVLLVALGIAILDALPLFGSGAVLIPWSIFHLLSGNVVLAIGLIAIYGIIAVMRQIMEPKVLSTQIGVYALVTVMAMYIGFKVIGVFGLIIGPIIAVMLKTLQTIGLLPNFKPVPDDDNEQPMKGQLKLDQLDKTNSK
ncbi:sporulation integral membrane protein YtvI [Niameybacter massiliensis]|uniref:sporulation integral membrane protein YtvI n=1 Tax=Niameybacter massiliensis TaxID=1658108 RepID=UPI0006B429FD|nr:sporulation integral membrane protein YtvI [Niameybacter massiliensis]